MKIFDSHCHLDDRNFKNDLGLVIERAKNEGIKGIMIAGVNQKSSETALKIAETHDMIYASVGIHPHDAKTSSKKVLDSIKSMSEHPKVRAWGEIGLDFNRLYSSIEDQEKCFIQQLEIVKELHLPIIFHERDSNGRFLSLLKNHSYPTLKAVVHCFSGSRAELKNYLNLGFYIGITGILTMKKRGATLRNLVQYIPANRILIETDAPYLTPAPQKNKTRRNEPAFVKSVLFKLAEIKGKDPISLSHVLWKNTCKLYGI